MLPWALGIDRKALLLQGSASMSILMRRGLDLSFSHHSARTTNSLGACQLTFLAGRR